MGAAKKLKFSGRRILGIASLAIGVVVLACVRIAFGILAIHIVPRAT